MPAVPARRLPDLIRGSINVAHGSPRRSRAMVRCGDDGHLQQGRGLDTGEDAPPSPTGMSDTQKCNDVSRHLLTVSRDIT